MLNERVKTANGACDLLFVGDSITQGWEDAGKTVWSHYYGHRKALNIGIGGDKTQHLLWRFDHGNLEGLDPKLVVLMIGTNNTGEERNNTGDIVAGVAKVVEALKTKLPRSKILLLGIFPRSQTFSYQRGQIAQVNQVIQKLADGERVLWNDFGPGFLDANGALPRELMPDYLHLSPKGYTLWAEAIEDTVARVLGDARVAPKTEVNLAGEWRWTTPGPDGQPVTGGLILEQSGTRITGKFERGPGRWLEFNDGVLKGTSVQWTVRRDRPDGSMMTYEMTGEWKDGKISGTTATQIDGSPVQSPWSAEKR